MLFFKLKTLSFTNFNLRSLAFWKEIEATDLGTGSTGGGTKYLADDMTWKTVVSGSSGGSGGVLDGGDRLLSGSFMDGGGRV